MPPILIWPHSEQSYQNPSVLHLHIVFATILVAFHLQWSYPRCCSIRWFCIYDASFFWKPKLSENLPKIASLSIFRPSIKSCRVSFWYLILSILEKRNFMMSNAVHYCCCVSGLSQCLFFWATFINFARNFCDEILILILILIFL